MSAMVCSLILKLIPAIETLHSLYKLPLMVDFSRVTKTKRRSEKSGKLQGFLPNLIFVYTGVAVAHKEPKSCRLRSMFTQSSTYEISINP